MQPIIRAVALVAAVPALAGADPAACGVRLDLGVARPQRGLPWAGSAARVVTGPPSHLPFD